ncbi:hypothetical protein [Rathayibacter soli]|uniref:hypothetical protein n=1 Tax=Rathayibacter soli TaxID=3144168 RepID=UPI0027E4BE94|nr:hypothetical protein [Glaciibacter superstes]
MIDYTQISTLSSYVLEESYFLEVIESRGKVELKADLVLARDHPDLLPARAGEWARYPEGVIRFTGVKDFLWTDRTKQAVDADGTRSWDGVDKFTQQCQTYTLEGDFGRMMIVADLVECELTGPA